VSRVAERIREGVGQSVRRVDGVPKVKGSFAYGSDLWAEEMLWGATVRSPHAFARVRGVDVSGAVAGPGVHAVLTHQDVPGKKTFGLEFSDQPVLAMDLVRHVGEPVAIVAAETPELARRAAHRVEVDYEVLDPVVDMERALDPAVPHIHEHGNVLRHVSIVHGDPDAQADVWVEGYYETAWQDQAALGPEAGLAIPAEDGGVDLFVTTQWLHVDRQQMAPCLGLPEDKVRISLAGLGGAFGSREDITLQIHACMLALYTGKPVKLSYGREESFFGHVHRHPSRIWSRLGATLDGKLVNAFVRLLIDGGAYASSSPAVIANATTFAVGPYEIPNARLEGTALYTNNPPCGAMRGFGAPQVCFAHEAQMDKLARAVGMDPIELRLKNALRTGSVLPTGQVIRGSAPAHEVIERCAAIPKPPRQDGGPRDVISLPGGAAGNVGRGERLRRGVGFAAGYKNIAYSEGFDDSSEAKVTLSRGPEGPVAEIHNAGVECGQGLHTILTQIARTELGVERVILHPVDTGVGSAGSSSASRQTFMSGGAVHRACQAVREALFDRIRASHGPGRGAWSLEAGVVLDGGEEMGRIEEFLDEPIAESAVFHHRRTEEFGPNGQGDIHVMFAFAAERAVVEVDEELGLLRVVHIAAAQDVGRAINPQGVTGQIEGGTAQGIGLAVMEELQVRDGAIKNASFTDYLIPTILDMPPVVSEIIEDPEPGVPYGAKGAGEPSTIVSTAAVVAAIRDAMGIALNRAPVKPDDLVGLRSPAPWREPAPIPDVPGPKPIPEYHGLGMGQQELMSGPGMEETSGPDSARR
jgi:xanthine dehydrogenase D subunit